MDGQFDRTPPQDIAAEQCVLGGMLLSKDAIADVVEILRSADFYRPAHATVFDAVLDLYGRGEPADPITVAAALADSGDLGRVGGAPYLHTLIASVPTAANAAYYARIVSERAVLRRLVEAGTRIVQLGYGAAAGAGRDVDDIVDLAQQAVYDVTERRISEDFAILSELLQPTLDEIEAVGAQGGVMTGVPTGFTDLDRLLNGLHPGQLIVVAGRPGLGKALALDTPLPTPDGWTTMGAVAVGGQLIGADGRPTTIVATSEVMLGRQCFEVELDDGGVVVADAEHLWRTTTRAGRQPRGEPTTATTAEIAATLRCPADGALNHAVANAAAFRLPGRDLLVPPYRLGAWLGDGHCAAARATPADPEMAMRVEADGIGAAATSRLRLLGVLDNAHIPVEYLRSSESQRRELLAGLMDANGSVGPTGALHYHSPSSRLADDVRELVTSLGYRCSVSAEPEQGRSATAPLVYTLAFSTEDQVFALPRKQLVHKRRHRPARRGAAPERFIVDVRPVPSVPVRCVQVDNVDHLYLAGRSMVPTHNSTASMDFARTAAVKFNLPSAIFSLEMSKVEIVMRLLAAEARVPLHVLRSGQLSDDDWTKLARRMGEISEAPLFVDDTPNMNLMEIRAKARRLKQRHELKLVVVDYLQLMTSPKRVESRQQEVAELSRGLKLLAKEIECPVVAVSQLNRGPEQRTDKRPQLSDLRESGCLTGATRLLRADTNAEVTLLELVASGATGVPVWALDDRLRYVPCTLTHAFPSGYREVLRVRLASGKEVEATGNHPFLTVDGWRPLTDLAVGSRVGVARHVPSPLRPATSWTDAEVLQLARSWRGSGPREPAHVAEALLPPEAAALPDRQLALFLGRVLAADGPAAPTRQGDSRLSYRSTSRRLVDGVSLMLLRFGVSTRLHTARSPAGRLEYTLDIPDRDDRRRLIRRISGCGTARPGEPLPPGWGKPDAKPYAATVLRQVRHQVREILVEGGSSRRELVEVTGARLSGALLPGRLPSGLPDGPAGAKPPLARIADVLSSADLELHAANDVLWDEIVQVEPCGRQDVYDATVLGAHNFVANGIAVHNSIEQDADVVILLHRDDYYDKESPRAGEADFIVAKHRNGPTDTVTVAAQLHLSRFVDMAIV
ncbi:MAG TPA: replicative DNA helicase [Micromonosporaceae bacterium]|nr:replicative DNA helicase [Micromonosporaceae bacterium]